MSHNKVVAVVPARARSQGLRNKNFRNFGQTSLTRLAIDVARQTPQVTDVVLTSDSWKAQKLAQECNVVWHNRSHWAASNEATAADVLRDFFAWWKARDPSHASTWFVYMQPTSPLRTSKHIDEAVKIAIANDSPVVSVRALDVPLEKIVAERSDGRLLVLCGDSAATSNRQQATDAFTPNGAIYVFRMEHADAVGGVPITGSIPFHMSRSESIDVDDLFDFELAEKEVMRRDAPGN